MKIYVNEIIRRAGVLFLMFSILLHQASPVFALQQASETVEAKSKTSDLLEHVAKLKGDKTTDELAKLRNTQNIPAPDLGIIDQANTSARKPRPFKLSKKVKSFYSAQESPEIAITNPDHQMLKPIIFDPKGETITMNVDQVEISDESFISIEPKTDFKPGKYKIVLTDSTGTRITQEFVWGVLAINTDKSIYKPEDTADISIAVLDDLGNMVCDAVLDLRILEPGERFAETYSTGNGKIINNPECASHDFTLKPDYEASYKIGALGLYKLRLTAQTKNGTYTIEDSFEAHESTRIDVKRISATRIYPKHKYPVLVQLTANEDFEGFISETVPQAFEIHELNDVQNYTSFIEEEIIDADTATKQMGDVLSSSISADVSPEPESSGSAVKNNEIVSFFSSIFNSIPQLSFPFSGMYPISLEFSEHLIDSYQRDLYERFGLIGHDGIDFAMATGTPVLSADDGQVILADKGDYGITIVIQHAWGRSYYGHLSETLVTKNSFVSKGTKIALSGNTGIATGPHLHFSIKPNTNDTANGYYGKINPKPFLGFKSDIPPVQAPVQKNVLGASAIPRETKSDTNNPEWNISLKKGETILIGYKYKAPEISPQFYTLGPLVIKSGDTVLFREARTWSIAVDAISGEDYRWYRNRDDIQPLTALGAENSPVIVPKSLNKLRLRMNLGASGTAISSNQFKIQYATSSAATNWCNDTNALHGCTATWSARRKITFNNFDSDVNLTDFPVLVKLDSTRIDYTKTQNSGQDIRFVDPSNPSAVLPHEIENWDEAGSSYVWVKVGQIDANSDTDYIWMYYGNSAPDGQQQTSVWNANYKMVHHLEESGACATTFTDSTTNGNNGTCVNTPLTTTSGKIYRARDFETEDTDGITISNIMGSPANITLQHWVEPITFDPTTSDTITFSVGEYVVIHIGTAQYSGAFYNGVSHTGIANTTNIFGTGWHHLAYIADQTNNEQYLLLDGKKAASGTSTAAIFWSGLLTNTMLGKHASAGSLDYNYDGHIDEARASDAAFTVDWVEAEYKSQSDQLNLFGEEESQTQYFWDDVMTWCNDASGTTCDTNWTKRKKIVFNNVGREALTNFPVLIALDSSRIDYGDSSPNNGSDIRFADPEDPTVALNHEVNSWNESGTSYVWVKVPQINANSDNDFIWMYYGNDSAAAPAAAHGQGVWANYTHVYHLENSTTNSVNGNTTAVFGTAGISTDIAGKLGNGRGKASPYTSYAMSITEDRSANPVTLQAWGKPDGLTTYQGLISHDWVANGGLLSFWTNGTLAFAIANAASSQSVLNSEALTNGVWYFGAGTYDGTTQELYLNGEPTEPNKSVTSYYSDTTPTINLLASGDRGAVDEVRISSVARSRDWIQADYKSMTDSMCTFGVEQTQTSVKWLFNDNASVADKADIGAGRVLSGSTSTGNHESYTESNPTEPNPVVINAGERREWDFSLNSVNATADTYYFRMVDGNNTVLNEYINYPSLTVGVPLSLIMRHGKYSSGNMIQAFSF